MRILVAEDNLVNQQVALKQLAKLGFHGDTVANGTEALAAAQRGAYDLILMDCQMPEIDGYEVTRRIRQAEKDAGRAGRGRAYIVALTAHALQGDRDRCLEAGMDDYLSKPLRLSSLQAALQRAMENLAAGEPGMPRACASADPCAPEQVSPSVPPDSEDSPDGSPALDTTLLAGLRGLQQPGQPNPLKDLGELFLRDARARLQTLESAMASRDAAEVARTAHALKGSASNLGARRLSALCAELEKQGKTAQLTDAASVLLTVTREFHAVESALITEMQK